MFGGRSIRLVLAFLVLTLAISEPLVLGAIAYGSLWFESHANEQLRQVIGSLEAKEALVVAVTRAASRAEVFSRKPDEASRQAFDREWKEVELRLSPCANAACHGVVERPARMLEQIRPAARRIRTTWDRLTTTGLEPKAIAESVPLMEQDAALIVRLAGGMSQRIQLRLRVLQQDSDSGRRTVFILLVLTTIGTAAGAMLLFYPLANGITRPLERLTEGARRLAAGDLDHRVPVEGGAETAMLARAFNEMADKLAQHQAWLKEELRKRDESLSVNERLTTIGLLASSVGHDLNNPLTAVLMNASLMAEQLPETDPMRPMVDRIVADCERCRAIIAQLRRMGQRRIGELTPCDAYQLLEDAVRSTRVRSSMQKVEIALAPGPDAPLLCNVDRQRLLPVLLNLIENAIDVSPPGEQILVRLRTEKGAPDRDGAVEEWVCLEVEDHGPGMPKDVREHIYKRFFTTKERGLGLGLAMARHSVEEHGGRLEYETRTSAELPELGDAGGHTGTTFRVKLPIKRQSGEDEA